MSLQGIADTFNMSADVFVGLVRPILEHTILEPVVSGCVAGMFGNPIGGVIFGGAAGVINGIAMGILTSQAGYTTAAIILRRVLFIPLYFVTVPAAMALTNALDFPMTLVNVCACTCAIFAANILLEIGRVAFVAFVISSLQLSSSKAGIAVGMFAGI